MAAMKVRLIRSKLLAGWLAFGVALSFLAGVALIAEAPSGERWFAVPVESNCLLYPEGQSGYLYNVDQNGDGAVDLAIWFFESDEIKGPDIDFYLLTEPQQSVHQWALAWYGFKATGACNDFQPRGSWVIRPSPGSIYANPEDQKVSLWVQMGIEYDETLTYRCRVSSACYPQMRDLTARWVWFDSGVWDSEAWVGEDPFDQEFDNARLELGDFDGQPDLAWDYRDTDLATQIQNEGHPLWPFLHELVSSSLLPGVDQALCKQISHPSGGDIYAVEVGMGELGQNFLPSGGTFGECWIVRDGPVAGFTFVPSNPTASHAVTFDASASTPNPGITSYLWDFGDSSGGNGVQVAHAYSSDGSYTVKLTIADAGGASDSLSYELDVGPEQPGTISGTVLDASSGNPVAYADMTLTGLHHAYSATANLQGQFSLNVHPDVYEVEAQRCDYYPGSESVTVSPGATSQTTIELTARILGTVYGYVTGGFLPPGSPLFNAIVRNYCTTAYDLTSSNGYYSLQIPTGISILVTAEKSGYVSVSKTVTASSGNPIRVDFFLPQDCPRCPN